MDLVDQVAVVEIVVLVVQQQQDKEMLVVLVLDLPVAVAAVVAVLIAPEVLDPGLDLVVPVAKVNRCHQHSKIPPFHLILLVNSVLLVEAVVVPPMAAKAAEGPVAAEMVEKTTPLKDIVARMAPEVVAVDQVEIHQIHRLHQEAVVLVDLESL